MADDCSYGAETLNTENAEEEGIVPYPQKLSDSAIWNDIINKRNEDLLELQFYLDSKSAPDDNIPINPHFQYLDDNIFPLLLPLLEKTILKAIRMECLKHQKSLFNGVDYIAEILWNTNTKHPERFPDQQNIFLIPWVQEWLKTHPRPIFPLSWIWTKEQGATKIQAYYRGHLVRRTEEVQEMRQFWKQLRRELEEEVKKDVISPEAYEGFVGQFTKVPDEENTE